ncbi:acyltransferase [Bacteroides thetaiotaomicron]|uniref:acyltransferase n=1 Tax=Bacteroides thetaiotaomicron TaxID=818 RepID=UPI001F22D743|nr:acyltransferase [Bacteroides thetaiotaomicron]MCE8953658.1 acyltransferase [Bacteroides thetaiotaomicron]MCE8971165.1 acyltransferase [Bacteroides thetaiotaomicron]
MSKIKSGIKTFLLYNVFKNWHLFHLIYRNLRPAILRYCGAEVGENVYISGGVHMDNNVEYLTIGDNVLISPNVMFLFHKRDLSGFCYGSLHNKQPHIKKAIKLCNNTSIGLGAIIMPGVTIGEGAAVAAGALVTKDVMPWTIVAGCPARVIRDYTIQ